MVKSVASFFATFVIATLLSGFALAQDESAKPKSLENDYIVGAWTVKGTIDGDQLKGNMRVRTGADNTCLIFNWTMRGDGSPRIGTAVAGPDPKTNRFAEYCFESTGSHFINRYEIKDDPSALGVGRGKRTGIINGKEYVGDIIVDRKTNDHFIYTVTSDKGVDVKLVFRRAEGGRGKRGKAVKS